MSADNHSRDHTEIDLVSSAETDPLVRISKGWTHHGNLYFEGPFMSEVDDNLWVGGCEWGLILPERIDHLISLYQWKEYEVNHDLMSTLTVRMYDERRRPDLDQVMALAGWVNACRKTGEVLVHCQAGLNRSGMVVALALMLEGRDVKEAVELLREKRSHASLCNPSFVEFLQGVQYRLDREREDG